MGISGLSDLIPDYLKNIFKSTTEPTPVSNDRKEESVEEKEASIVFDNMQTRLEGEGYSKDVSGLKIPHEKGPNYRQWLGSKGDEKSADRVVIEQRGSQLTISKWVWFSPDPPGMGQRFGIKKQENISDAERRFLKTLAEESKPANKVLKETSSQSHFVEFVITDPPKPQHLQEAIIQIPKNSESMPTTLIPVTVRSFSGNQITFEYASNNGNGMVKNTAVFTYKQDRSGSITWHENDKQINLNSTDPADAIKTKKLNEEYEWLLKGTLKKFDETPNPLMSENEVQNKNLLKLMLKDLTQTLKDLLGPNLTHGAGTGIPSGSPKVISETPLPKY